MFNSPNSYKTMKPRWEMGIGTFIGRQPVFYNSLSIYERIKFYLI
jgi:hypothetical protein